jgi:hypothetical protein
MREARVVRRYMGTYTVATKVHGSIERLIHLTAIVAKDLGKRADDVKAVIYSDGSGHMQKGDEELPMWESAEERELMVLRWVTDEMERQHEAVEAKMLDTGNRE